MHSVSSQAPWGSLSHFRHPTRLSKTGAPPVRGGRGSPTTTHPVPKLGWNRLLPVGEEGVVLVWDWRQREVDAIRSGGLEAPQMYSVSVRWSIAKLEVVGIVTFFLLQTG